MFPQTRGAQPATSRPSTDRSPHFLARVIALLALALVPVACEEPVVAPHLMIPGPAGDRVDAATEREALAALYVATDGPNWTRNDNWLSNAPLDEWYGIVTNDEGQVRWLTLWDNGLKGPIVPDLGDLAALELLGLGDNELNGVVPAALASATALTGLWVDNNLLSGAIPSSFLELSELRVLDFSGNEELCIPGTVRFNEWADSVSLVSGPDCSEADAEILRVFHERTGGSFWTNSDGWFSDAALSEWHGVETDTIGRVTGLGLSRNGLSGQLPDSLSELSALVKLDVSGNILAGALPATLTALALEELRYADTRLCVPQEEDFLEWLAGIAQHEGSDRECPPTSQYDILASIYEATNGRDWENNDNWVTNAPLNEWYGVSTDADGRVTGLHLGFNNLQGKIPPAIGGLTKLQNLDLSVNLHLSGPLPAEFFQLSNLQYLYLPSVGLGGPLSPEFGELTELRVLNLAATGLGGPLPPEIGRLSKLERLFLQNNDLTGPIPPELGNLKELRQLILWYNEFSGELPAELGNLTSLEELDLDRNELTGSIPAEFGNLQSLEELWLNDNALTGSLPAALGNLGQLRDLYLNGNGLEGVIPPEFGQMTALDKLWVADNQGLSGPLPASLTTLDALTSLKAGGTELCAPADEDFLAWLAGVEFQRVARCEGGAPAYLVQAVQSIEWPVPLVADRPALLRVFISSPYADGERMPAVRATFFHGDTQVHVAEIPSGAAAIPSEIDEGSLAHSANADIPGEVLKPGLEMVIDVDPDGTLSPALGIAKRIPETGRLAVDVRDMPDFKLTLVPFLYESEPDSSILEITASMADNPETDAMLGPTRTLLPVGGLDVTLHPPVMASTNNGFTILRETEAIRVLEGTPGYWLAMLAPAPLFGLFGVANGIGSWTSFSVPLPGTVAHEFGHNLALFHAPCGGAGGPDPLYPNRFGRIGSWGYDRDRGRLVSPFATDIMTYCDGGWVGDYHFSNALRQRLDVENAPHPDKTPSVLVWGGRDADGELFLEPAFMVDAVPQLPPSGSEYRIRGTTVTGAEAFSLSFDMPYIPDVEDERSSFVFAVPVNWAEALASISLAGGDASVTLDQASNLPMTIMLDPVTGQIRAMLREPETAAMGAFGSAEVQRLEVLFSRGIPDAGTQRR